MIIITPQMLWENYDRTAEPTPNIIFEKEGEKRLYFNGYAAGGCVVRVYARLVLPAGVANPPVIILASPAKADIDCENTDFFTDKGFAVLLVDYFGKRDDKTHFTVYPKAIDAFWEADPQKIKDAPKDLKKSCWYYWTTCLLHSVTFLEQCGLVDKNRIGIVGVNEGSSLVFKASFCKEIKAGVTFFNGDLTGGEEFLAYKAGLDSRAYAKNCFPVLINAATNEKSGSFDYLSDLFNSSANCCFCVYPSADRAISEIQRANLKLWFDSVFGGEWTVPGKPALSVFGSDGAVYAEVAGPAESVKIYYAEENPAAFRNWREVIPDRAGENKYLSRLAIFKAEKPIHVFANISYKSGFTFSSPVVVRQSDKLGAIKPEASTSRLIYRPESGTKGWIVRGDSLRDADELKIEEGPFGLKGICGNRLITFKAGDSRYNTSPGSLLQFIISAKEPQDAEISVIDAENGNTYKCYKKISDKEWTTLTLSDEDFKSAKGPPKFDRIAGIKIQGKNIILNSILWV